MRSKDQSAGIVLQMQVPYCGSDKKMPTGTAVRIHLSGSQRFWSLVHLHSSQAHAHGPRGYNDNVVTIFHKFDGGLDDEGHNGEYGLMGLLMYN